jgi:hypothetical protein
MQDDAEQRRMQQSRSMRYCAIFTAIRDSKPCSPKIELNDWKQKVLADGTKVNASKRR